MRAIRPIQAAMLAVPLVLLFWLLWQEAVPTGVFHVRHVVNQPSPFIERLLPDNRVEPPYKDAAGDWVQPIVDDPAFFFVHPHRQFDTVEVEVWMKNEDVPIVEMGALANPETDTYDLQPLQNLLIDNSTWNRTESDGLVLLQRNPAYASIEDFLTNPPAREEIATYNYKLTQPYILSGYVPSSASHTIDVSLRGFHEFKTYLKDETLSLEIAYMDMNRDDGTDSITIFVSDWSGAPVAEMRADDDGNIGDDAIPSALRSVELSVPGLQEGVYKVELRASRDIFFRTLTTTQQKIVFLNNVYLADEIAWKEPARSVLFWTEAKHVAFTTQHAEGVQVVIVGNQQVPVAEPYARTPVDVQAEGIVGVIAPKGDMIVNADGHIAFAPDQYFNPDPVRLLPNTDLDKLGVNYVVARYVSPRHVGDWIVAHATFETAKLALLEDKTWKFVFSTPLIRELETQLLVGRIDMVWKREPLHVTDIVNWLKTYAS